MNIALARWHALDLHAAAEEISPCNGSRAWAVALARGRPFASEAALLEAADVVWAGLDASAWQQAFDSHPRIGERHATAASAASLQWSAGEQSVAGEDAAAQLALAEGNLRYETRFGRIFLVCASGKRAAEMLAALERRLGHEPATEWQEAAEQQRRITQLRLRKWLGLPPARCEDV